MIRGHWTDAVSREIWPDAPRESSFGYQLGDLGTVKSSTGNLSVIQSYVVGRQQIYPFCVFWETL